MKRRSKVAKADYKESSDEGEQSDFQENSSTAQTASSVRKVKSKKNRPVQQAPKQPELSSQLFDVIYAKSASLDASVLDLLGQEKQEQILQLVQLILRVSGCTQQMEECEDADAIPDQLELLQAYQQGFVECQLLNQKGAQLTKRYSLFWQKYLTRVLGSTDQTEHDYLTSFLLTLSSSSYRPFRMCATLTSMLWMNSLVASIATLNQSIVQTQLKLTSQKLNESQKIDVELVSEQLQAQSATLKSQLNSFYDGVFVHRYRDTNESIRRETVRHLGEWVAQLPDMFGDPKYLRYLGWSLSDTSAMVRLVAAEQFGAVCRGSVSVGKFLDRFKDRVIEMAACDKDLQVRISVQSLVVPQLIKQGIIQNVQLLYPVILHPQSLITHCLLEHHLALSRGDIQALFKWMLDIVKICEDQRIEMEVKLGGDKEKLLDDPLQFHKTMRKLWNSVLECIDNSSFESSSEDVKDGVEILKNSLNVTLLDDLSDALDIAVRSCMLACVTAVVDRQLNSRKQEVFEEFVRIIYARLQTLIEQLPLLCDGETSQVNLGNLHLSNAHCVLAICRYALVGLVEDDIIKIHAAPVWCEVRKQQEYISSVDTLFEKFLMRESDIDLLLDVGKLLQSLNDDDSPLKGQLDVVCKVYADRIREDLVALLSGDQEDQLLRLRLKRQVALPGQIDFDLTMNMVSSSLGNQHQQLNACRNFLRNPASPLNLAYSYNDFDDTVISINISNKIQNVTLMLQCLGATPQCNNDQTLLVVAASMDVLHIAKIRMQQLLMQAQQEAELSDDIGQLFGDVSHLQDISSEQSLRDIEIAAVQECRSVKLIYEDELCCSVFGFKQQGSSLLQLITEIAMSDSLPRNFVDHIGHYVQMLSVDLLDNFLFNLMSQQAREEVSVNLNDVAQVSLCSEVYARLLSIPDTRIRCSHKSYYDPVMRNHLSASFKQCMNQSLRWLGRSLSNSGHLQSTALQFISRCAVWHGNLENKWLDSLSRFVIQEFKASIVNNGRIQSDDEHSAVLMITQLLRYSLEWHSSHVVIGSDNSDAVHSILKLVIGTFRPSRPNSRKLQNDAQHIRELASIRALFQSIHSQLLTTFIDSVLALVEDDQQFATSQMQQVVNEYMLTTFKSLSTLIGSAGGFGMELISVEDAALLIEQVKQIVERKHKKVLQALEVGTQEQWRDEFNKYVRSLTNITKKGHTLKRSKATARQTLQVPSSDPFNSVVSSRLPSVTDANSPIAPSKRLSEDLQQENEPSFEVANVIAPDVQSSPNVKRSKLMF